MSTDARSERIAADLEAALAPHELLVEDLTVTAAGKRRLVRVLVDRTVPDPVGDTPVAPLSLDEVGEATKVVSDLLDGSDAMGETPYVLEVSSPGTDRPLTLPRHYRRNVGRLVQLTRTDGGTLTGRIAATGPDAVTVDDTAVAYADITKARVQVEFNRPDGEDA